MRLSLPRPVPSLRVFCTLQRGGACVCVVCVFVLCVGLARGACGGTRQSGRAAAAQRMRALEGQELCSCRVKLHVLYHARLRAAHSGRSVGCRLPITRLPPFVQRCRQRHQHCRHTSDDES